MRTHRTSYRSWLSLGATAAYIALIALVATMGDPAHAGLALEERKLPEIQLGRLSANRGWVSAVGIVTARAPRDFDDFARDRQLRVKLSC